MPLDYCHAHARFYDLDRDILCPACEQEVVIDAREDHVRAHFNDAPEYFAVGADDLEATIRLLTISERR